ncbi:MAG: hypothetical protein ACR65O_08855 [Methylomicrobium sp.]
MFTQSFKRYTIHRLIILIFAAGGLLSTAAYGQGGENEAQPPASSAIPADTRLPSVEQALVPEGVFAIQLAEALKLGSSPDETEAEALLSGLGIEPDNGWITDYPVTPTVLGDIEKGIVAASEQGKLSLPKDQALKLLGEVKTRLGLDVKPAPKAPAGLSRKPGKKTLYRYIDSQGVTHYTDVYESIPAEYRSSVRTLSLPAAQEISDIPWDSPAGVSVPESLATPLPDDINDYYEEQGPPVVTYYSPPAPYDYLYSWTPYPFWSTGVYFPGFFVLNNFHRKITFNRHPHFVSHHAKVGKHHRHPFSAGPVKGSHAKSKRLAPSPWFSTPKARTGAKAIVSRKQNRDRAIPWTTQPRTPASRKPFSTQRRHSRARENNPIVIPWDKSPKVGSRGRAPTVIPWDNRPRALHRQTIRSPREARLSQPFSGRTRSRIHVPQRSYSAPAVRENRMSRPSRSFGSNFSGRSLHRGTVGGFQGSRSIGGHGGGSFRGGARGRR